MILFTYLFIYLFIIYLFIYLFVCLFVCLFIYDHRTSRCWNFFRLASYRVLFYFFFFGLNANWIMTLQLLLNSFFPVLAKSRIFVTLSAVWMFAALKLPLIILFFYFVFYKIGVLSSFWPVFCFPYIWKLGSVLCAHLPSVVCFFCFSWLHVFPPSPLVTCFPALIIIWMFFAALLIVYNLFCR